MNILIPLLSALFIGLKLADIIDWSWWWVLSPIWISGIISMLIMGTMAIFVEKNRLRFTK